MATPRATNTAALIVLSLAGLATQLLVPCPRDSQLWNSLFDAGHVVVYGVVALAAHRLIRRRLGTRSTRPLATHAFALALTTALGAATEGLQALGLGDASLGDLLRDVLGAAGFLLASIAFVGIDPHAGSSRGPARGLPARGTGRGARLAAGVAAVAALAAALAPMAGTALAYLGRNADFPLLCSFDRRWERAFVRAGDQAVLDRAVPPRAWVRGSDAARPSEDPRLDLAGRLAFHPGVYPGLVIHELVPDWRGYHRFVFDAYSELDSTIALELRLNDDRHDNAWADRFNRVLAIHPGANRIEIPLDEVRSAPRGRAMEMNRMRTLVLFAHRTERTFVIWLDDFRLE